jgi:hypothetical protein
VSDDPRRLTTFEQRDRLQTARKRGGLCAVCGRSLGDGKPVYWEQLVVDIERSVEGRTSRYWTTLKAPVGRECASPEILEETKGQEPERCAGCGRPVYYRPNRPNRRRALCSKYCGPRASRAARSARTGEG